jgi:hypothetical protein
MSMDAFEQETHVKRQQQNVTQNCEMRKMEIVSSECEQTNRRLRTEAKRHRDLGSETCLAADASNLLSSHFDLQRLGKTAKSRMSNSARTLKKIIVFSYLEIIKSASA